MEKFINILKQNKEISAWKINSVSKKSCELFYVSDKLETNRATDVTKYRITIYVDKDGKRGSSTFSAFDYMSEDELNKKISENVYAASFAMNPYYDIPDKEASTIETCKSNLQEKPFNEIISDVVDAVFAANVYKEGYLSATEFFLNEITERIVNSNGVDVTSKTCSGNIELIPSWEKDGHEVELYHMINFESFEPKAITEEVNEKLLLAKARFEAKELEHKEGIKVILQDEEVSDILDYFIGELSYSAKYIKSNKFELGENVQGENVSGDILNIKLVPYYENAFSSRPFDSDGVILKEVEVIKDGVAINRHGSYQYGYYLGEKHPTGILPIKVVSEGTKSFAEMSKEPYIRCVQFSGIQVESNSGFFGGEVRLGFYFDGEKEIPVTGFSISGDLNVSRGTFVLSKETVTKSSYHGPKYMELKDMTIL